MSSLAATAETKPPLASPSRRVVKAKAPPPSLDLPPKPVAEPDDDPQDEGHAAYPGLSPSVARELEQERTEKWRKERYDATVAKQKQQRDKDLQHRRQNSGSITPTQSSDTPSVPVDIPASLSVEPQFPEHKRSGETASVGEPVVKRRKASVGDDDAPNKNEVDRVTFAKKIVVITAALAAVIAVGFAISRRSHRS